MSDFDGNDVNSWRTVLHKAAAALQQNPGDTEAQQWKQRALENIGELEDIANKKDKREASDLGKGTAFALGAARGMSFGLGDAAQKLTDSPSEQQAVETTEATHPGSTLLGTIAGGAVPFIAAPYASGGLLAGASPAAVNTGLGAAQGFGLTPGDVGDRLKGAVLGGALARFGPAAAKFAAKGVSGLAGRIIGAIPKAAPVAEAAADAGATIGGKSEESVRAMLAQDGYKPDAIERTIARLRAGEQRLSGAVSTDQEPVVLPKDYAKGRLGPMSRSTPDPLEQPTYLRRGGYTPPDQPIFTPVEEGATPISEGSPGSAKPIPPQPGLRGPGGSQRWSTTQIGAPGLNLNSPAAEAQLRTLQKMSPDQLREALKNPLLAQLAKALGVR